MWCLPDPWYSIGLRGLAEVRHGPVLEFAVVGMEAVCAAVTRGNGVLACAVVG